MRLRLASFRLGCDDVVLMAVFAAAVTGLNEWLGRTLK